MPLLSSHGGSGGGGGRECSCASECSADAPRAHPREDNPPNAERIFLRWFSIIIHVIRIPVRVLFSQYFRDHNQCRVVDQKKKKKDFSMAPINLLPVAQCVYNFSRVVLSVVWLTSHSFFTADSLTHVSQLVTF